MNISAKNNAPKINMQQSIVAHDDFDAEEIRSAEENMRKALRSRNFSEAEVEARVSKAFA